MMVLQVIGEAIGLAVGSLVVSVLFCWLCWNLFKLVRHPEWGVPFGLVVLLGVWSEGFIRSPFLRQALVYAVMAAVVLWSFGREWRRRNCSPHSK